MAFPGEPGKDFWLDQYFKAHQLVHQAGAVKLSYTGQRLYYQWHDTHAASSLIDMAGVFQREGQDFADQGRPLAANIYFGLSAVALVLRLWWRPTSPQADLAVRDLQRGEWAQDPTRPNGPAPKTTSTLAFASYSDCAHAADLCLEYAKTFAPNDPRKYAEQTVAAAIQTEYLPTINSLTELNKIVSAHMFT